jgi:hypothetical protein
MWVGWAVALSRDAGRSVRGKVIGVVCPVRLGKVEDLGAWFLGSVVTTSCVDGVLYFLDYDDAPPGEEFLAHL